jgi:ABC-type bacteriocin/lantibiotic exporter with double-glycine peptidase domain
MGGGDRYVHRGVVKAVRSDAPLSRQRCDGRARPQPDRLALGCYRILRHQLTFGELLALQMLAGRLIAPIISSGDIWRQYQETRVALTELGRFMAEPQEHAAARPSLRQLAVGGISAADLTLRYAPTARPALDSISFRLPPRGRFAPLARNGSGKSSLIRILPGLQRRFEGEVLIAGHDHSAERVRNQPAG